MDADKRVNVNAATTVITQLALGTRQLDSVYASAGFKRVTMPKINEAEVVSTSCMRRLPPSPQCFDNSPRTKGLWIPAMLADGDVYQRYMAVSSQRWSALNGQVLLLNKKALPFCQLQNSGAA